MKVTPIFIEGKTVNLSPVDAEHLDLYIKWENSEEIRKFARNVHPLTLEECKQRYFEEKQDYPDRIIFEIWYKPENKPIGKAEFHRIRWIDRKGEIGLVIGEKEYWGRNLATEAATLLIKYGFEELNFHKITAMIFSPNIGSWRCAEKLGLHKEATLIKNGYVDGEYRDDYIYCIFKNEWFSR